VVLPRLEAEANEMWSFVQKKANRQWVWIAMDATTRQAMAFHVRDRRRDNAKELWAKIPLVYCEQATFHADQYDTYQGVIPVARHQAITKKAWKTNHIERFNNTLRQRVSRLVRGTLSFSKKLANHIGAIKFFICYYNLAKASALEFISIYDMLCLQRKEATAMGHVRFTDLQTRPLEVLDLTSLTLDEFRRLVPPFEAAFQAHMAQWRFDGQPRTARR
jgi:insertion element IS1 protein InsB